MKILLIMFFAVIALQSCQSEYNERMKKAVELKQKYQEVQKNSNSSQNPLAEIELDEIKKQINFHATLSGNETVFLQQIWNN